MTERSPNTKEFIDKHPHITRGILGILRLRDYARAFSEDGWKGFKQELDLKNMHGLLKGALIGAGIVYPEGNQLAYKQPLAGQFISYDVNLAHLPTSDWYPLVNEGRLAAFAMRQIIDNPPEKETPLHAFNLSSYLAFRDYGHFTPKELLDMGFLYETTHCEASINLGLGDNYREALLQQGISDERAYQVTPKGNGLVMLVGDDGQQEPRRSAREALAFGDWSPVTALS